MTFAIAEPLPTRVCDVKPLVEMMEAWIPNLFGPSSYQKFTSTPVIPDRSTEAGFVMDSAAQPVDIPWDTMALMVKLAGLSETDHLSTFDVQELVSISQPSVAAIADFRRRTDDLFAALEAGGTLQFAAETRNLARRVADERKSRSTENVKSWARGLVRSLYINR